MNYIVILLFCAAQIVLADGGMIGPNPETQTPALGFTSEGIAKIKKYDSEIKGLFNTINQRLDEIDKKYNNINKMIENIDEDSLCSAFDDIKLDINDVDKKITEVKGKTSNPDDINRLNNYKNIYKKSYNYYKNILNNKKIQCY